MGIGVYICYCGTNIAARVDVEAVADYARKLPGVVARKERVRLRAMDITELVLQAMQSNP